MNSREVFATAIWNNIPSDEDASWVTNASTRSILKQPMGDYGAIVQDMLDRGVTAESIARFAKIVGFETASGICSALDDSSFSFKNSNYEPSIHWGLFRTEPETNEVIEPILGIHEILLAMDPTGNEMEPTKEALSAFHKSHHDIVVSGNALLRRKWMCDYLNTSDIEVFEFQSQAFPFEIKPKWPGRRIGFFLAFTDEAIWIMSNGLSNPEHPTDNADWHRVVPLPAPEILSRVPIGTITRRSKITDLVKNKQIQKFIDIACSSLTLHSDRASRRVPHISAQVNLHNIDDTSNTKNSILIHFSNLENMELADPIPLSDHEFLRVPVNIATSVDSSEMDTANADAFEYSKQLQQNGLLGHI